jgi:transcriptional regulator with XRE-family HTH domain
VSFDIRLYDLGQTESSMPKKKLHTKSSETFGQRLARLRKAAGYSQRSLAAELDISQRMVAYYESQTEHPPTHLFPALADALGITSDQLLGRERIRPRKAPRNERLLRQLRQVEKLPPRARHAVLETIEGLVTRYGTHN